MAKVFHNMPDSDRSTPLSADALKAKKVLRKYPDRVPVLVRQAPTTSLPELDKKLLVPRTMTCAGLRDIMPKHLGCASEQIAWDRLGLFMGDVPLKDTAIMEKVYNQYVDDNDGGLHITVKIDVPWESPAPVHSLPETSTEIAAVREVHEPVDAGQDAVAVQAELAALKAELSTASDVKAELETAVAAAERSAAAAQQSLAVEAERALVAEQNVAHLGQVYLAETKKTAELQLALQKAELQAQTLEREEGEAARELREAVEAKIEEVAELQDDVAGKAKEIADLKSRLAGAEMELEDASARIQRAASDEAALVEKLRLERTDRASAKEQALASAKAAEEKASAQEQRLRDLELKLLRMEEQLASESQLKAQAQKEAKALSESLAYTEKELENERKVAASCGSAAMQEQTAEGFVHLGWDQEGFAAELDDEENGFEVLEPSEHNLSTLRYAQRTSLA